MKVRMRVRILGEDFVDVLRIDGKLFWNRYVWNAKTKKLLKSLVIILFIKDKFSIKNPYLLARCCSTKNALRS